MNVRKMTVELIERYMQVCRAKEHLKVSAESVSQGIDTAHNYLSNL